MGCAEGGTENRSVGHNGKGQPVPKVSPPRLQQHFVHVITLLLPLSQVRITETWGQFTRLRQQQQQGVRMQRTIV